MAERGAGWGAVVGLGAVTLLLSVINPALLVFIPLALMLLALSGKGRSMLFGAVLLMLILAGVGTSDGPLWYVERAWGLMLGGWFLLAALAWPGARFFPRALLAIAGAAVTAGIVLMVGQGWASVDWALGDRFDAAALEAARLWGAGVGDAAGSGLVTSTMQRAVELQALVYPALLGLASLAGLAVAWWAYQRLADGGLQPLGALREFRFSDELVWLLVAGILLVILPLGDGSLRAGSNVMTFMGALYGLRGLAVVLALVGSPGPAVAIVGGLIFLVLYPLVLTATVVVGLGDTWLDLRKRLRPAEQGES